MTHNAVQTTTIHVPIIVSTIWIGKKRHHGGSTHGRRYIRRDRKERHDLIINDYFKGEHSKYTSKHFRRRFRMDMELFKKILLAIGNYDDYFIQKVDAVGKEGLSPLQKMIATVQMHAYGCPADILDGYVQIGEKVFEKQYLRKPNKDDIARLLQEGDDRGFPCGFKRVHTLILKVVASKNLWIWHAFFGMVGTNNDIIVLDRSPLFDDLINGVAPPCNFVVQGHHYNMGYYLSDGIYPQYATLIQTISQPSSIKEKFFAKHQEAARKDVERAFRVLQSRWQFVKGPARIWTARDLGKIMKTCIILHNMIIESEHQQGINLECWQPHGDNRVEDVHLEHDYTFLVSRMINRMKQVQDKMMHTDLKIDLINHLWDIYGDRQAV
ncbi:hypothetical protein Ddye_020327 [Dipteronia dyeriana]|uniref:Protein ALP1-like n=1 Tax=Dipteronia dyeriana TaxID=168575 RepID=A0AAD9U008_9ROSI|nr:hypothetical protein Ddye_020327 [Dipteronia dyeriana]